MKCLAPLAALAAAACATTPTPPPEPVIRTVEVRVPVPQPCEARERIGPAPAYPDSDAALGAAADLFARVRLLMAARTLKDARLAALESAIDACR